MDVKDHLCWVYPSTLKGLLFSGASLSLSGTSNQKQLGFLSTWVVLLGVGVKLLDDTLCIKRRTFTQHFNNDVSKWKLWTLWKVTLL